MKGVIPSLCHKSKQSWPNFFDTRPGGIVTLSNASAVPYDPRSPRFSRQSEVRNPAECMRRPRKKVSSWLGIEPAARIRPVSRIYPREVRAWNLAPSLETVWNRITRWICSAILRSKVFGSACNSLPRPSGGRKSWNRGSPDVF